MAYDIAYQPIKEELGAGDLPSGRVLPIFYFLLVNHRYVYLHVSAGPEKARGVRFPGTGVLDDCESPDMGAENLTHVLCKSSKCP